MNYDNYDIHLKCVLDHNPSKGDDRQGTFAGQMARGVCLKYQQTYTCP